MSTVKEILKAFWEYSEDYDGRISCRKVAEKDGCELYEVETDGNRYVAAIWANTEYAPDRNVVFFKADDGNVWHTTDGGTAVEIDGLPHLVDIGEDKTPSEIAEKAGVSLATVYRRARELGRLPTVEELQVKRKSPGRPRKY